MKIGICGICGRMGIAVLENILQRQHELAAAFEMPSSSGIGRDSGELLHDNKKLNIAVSVMDEEAVKKCDCVIDFSSPAASMSLLAAAVAGKTALVIGTTGFTDEQRAEIEKASKKIPIVFAPNTALGVNLLFKLTEMASRAVDESFDVEIVEAHHRLKKDAPSGTAKQLAEIVRGSMKGMKDAAIVTGRNGIIGERPSKEIGLMALRGGDVVGEHTVYFLTEGERIELTIRSTKRENNAKGAALAAEFLYGKESGLFSMFDVLGL